MWSVISDVLNKSNTRRLARLHVDPIVFSSKMGSQLFIRADYASISIWSSYGGGDFMGIGELRGARKSDQIIVKLSELLEINHIPLPRQLLALHVLYRCYLSRLKRD